MPKLNTLFGYFSTSTIFSFRTIQSHFCPMLLFSDEDTEVENQRDILAFSFLLSTYQTKQHILQTSYFSSSPLCDMPFALTQNFDTIQTKS